MGSQLLDPVYEVLQPTAILMTQYSKESTRVSDTSLRLFHLRVSYCKQIFQHKTKQVLTVLKHVLGIHVFEVAMVDGGQSLSVRCSCSSYFCH